MLIYGEEISKDYEHEATIIQSMIEYANKGNEVSILGKGKSMEPLLHDGRDYAYLRKIDDGEVLKKGDIVLYFSNGHYILHRIHHIDSKGYHMLGDGNITIESPLARERIELIATKIKRKGKIIPLNKWYIKLYGMIWLKLGKHKLKVYKIKDVIKSIIKTAIKPFRHHREDV